MGNQTESTQKLDPHPTLSKRDSILEAATRVFLDSGYAAASMDCIAGEAGVSKQTIYSHFECKDSLYGAIIREKCNQLLGAISMPATQAADPESALTGVGRRFLVLVLADEGMSHFRSVVAESGRFPELAEAFYRSGPQLAVKNLAVYLKDASNKGLLAVSDPKRAAQLFFGMLRGDLYLRRLLALDSEPAPEDIDRTVGEAVTVFLAAHAAGS